MATEKQIAANRRNALKSTGPRTESGKAVSRCNALCHGLGAKPDGLSIGDVNELSQIRRDLTQSFQPRTPQQERWIGQMAFARWQLLRWRRVEAEELSEPSFPDPLHQARMMELIAYRQANQQGNFTKALERYRRSTRALIS
jgi:hypothetical protein